MLVIYSEHYFLDLLYLVLVTKNLYVSDKQDTESLYNCTKYILIGTCAPNRKGSCQCLFPNISLRFSSLPLYHPEKVNHIINKSFRN